MNTNRGETGRVVRIGATAIMAVSLLAGCGSTSGDDTADGGSTSATPSGGTSSTGGSTTTGPTGSNASPAAPTPVKGKPASVTVGASGDIMTYINQAAIGRRAAGGKGYDFSAFFAPTKPIIEKSDVAICQLEGPVSSDNTNLMSRDLVFNQPREIVTTLKNTGFDGCSTANNHAYDQGLKGLKSTLSVMKQAGLKSSGPGASADEDGQPAFYEAGGFKIAQLSYSYTLNNSLVSRTDVPKDAPWFSKNLWAARKAEGIEQDAAAARKQGADLVLVSLHWGTEYKHTPDDIHRALAKELLTSGQVDWIIGNHPHVVQTCEKIDGHYVNYALGNFSSGQIARALPAGISVADGIYANVTFTRDADGKITQKETYQPVFDNQTTRVVELATPTQNADSYRRTTSTMSTLGCDATPAH